MIPLSDRSQRVASFAPAVYAIVLLNAYVFARELHAPDVNRFIDAFAVIPFDLTHGVQLPPPAPDPQWLTLGTALFLHGSYLHIVFNLLFLIVFGPAIEATLGSVRFTAFYLLCGVLAGIAQIVASPASHVPEIGASGAIAGVLGAYVLLFPTNRIATVIPIGCLPLFVRLPAIVVIGVWAAVQFIHGFGAVDPRVGSEAGGVAYFAHIGGFLAGILLAGPMRPRRRGV